VAALPHDTNVPPLFSSQPVTPRRTLPCILQVATVLVTAGAASTNASIYVGNDSTSVQANTRVAVRNWSFIITSPFWLCACTSLMLPSVSQHKPAAWLLPLPALPVILLLQRS
jgi:hypothetical protein